MTIYILVCLVLAIVFGGSWYAYRIAFYSPNKNRDKIPEVKDPKYQPYKDQLRDMFHALENKPCEFVTIQSRDGLTLSGRYYHQKDGSPLAIGFHGYKSCWLTDFCGGADIAFQMGQNVLLIDERAHGMSQGKSITFGIKERQDLLCWIGYALERFGADTKILLYGVSMGGATVLMASELELPDNVKGVIADSPFSAPIDIIETVAVDMGIPRIVIKPLASAAARIFGGFDIYGASAVEAVKKAKVPILIIHGEDDRFVPCEMGRAIYAACPEGAELVTFPDAGHAISYLADEPRYRSIINGFWEKVYEK